MNTPQKRWLTACGAVVVLVAISVLWIGCAAPRPANLGLTAGRLSVCPASPNCVSSQADPADAEHYAKPLPVGGDSAVAWERARQAALALPGASLLEDRGDYLAFEVTSRVFRFVDDLELALDAQAGVIHLRSSSRLGYSDLGANRKRIEALRETYGAVLATEGK